MKEIKGNKRNIQNKKNNKKSNKTKGKNEAQLSCIFFLNSAVYFFYLNEMTLKLSYVV